MYSFHYVKNFKIVVPMFCYGVSTRLLNFLLLRFLYSVSQVQMREIGTDLWKLNPESRRLLICVPRFKIPVPFKSWRFIFRFSLFIEDVFESGGLSVQDQRAAAPSVKFIRVPAALFRPGIMESFMPLPAAINYF